MVVNIVVFDVLHGSQALFQKTLRGQKGKGTYLCEAVQRARIIL
jgi:hypothetical protein